MTAMSAISAIYPIAPILLVEDISLRFAKLLCAGVLVLSLPVSARSQRPAMANHIRSEMEFLASDALQGRGSGTHEELIAAVYLASELRRLGIQPAGDNGGYIQQVRIERRLRGGESRPWTTRNVIGILPGRDPNLKNQVILLTAHLDHLGIGKPVDGDNIYNGADDDASGCVAVLELALVLSQGPRPRRTVIFTFFGSEET